MYDDFAPSGGNQWWRDPFTARRVARWSLPALAALAAVSSLVGGAVGGILTAAIIVALPVMAFFEARGSLFVLHYATSAHPPRRFPPKWWPWFAAFAGSLPLLLAGGRLAGQIGGVAGDMLFASSLTAAGGLFFGGLFTLLGYYLDKELLAWFDRTAEEEARAIQRDAQRAQRREGNTNRKD